MHCKLSIWLQHLHYLAYVTIFTFQHACKLTKPKCLFHLHIHTYTQEIHENQWCCHRGGYEVMGRLLPPPGGEFLCLWQGCHNWRERSEITFSEFKKIFIDCIKLRTTTTVLQQFTQVSQYQKKHSPTHTYPDHLSSFTSCLHLLRSRASSLFNLHAWQSFCTTSVQVLFGLPLGLASSTSYTIHFFNQSLSSFRNTCP